MHTLEFWEPPYRRRKKNVCRTLPSFSWGLSRVIARCALDYSYFNLPRVSSSFKSRDDVLTENLQDDSLRKELHFNWRNYQRAHSKIRKEVFFFPVAWASDELLISAAGTSSSRAHAHTHTHTKKNFFCCAFVVILVENPRNFSRGRPPSFYWKLACCIHTHTHTEKIKWMGAQELEDTVESWGLYPGPHVATSGSSFLESPLAPCSRRRRRRREKGTTAPSGVTMHTFSAFAAADGSTYFLSLSLSLSIRVHSPFLWLSFSACTHTHAPFLRFFNSWKTPNHRSSQSFSYGGIFNKSFSRVRGASLRASINFEEFFTIPNEWMNKKGCIASV